MNDIPPDSNQIDWTKYRKPSDDRIGYSVFQLWIDYATCMNKRNLPFEVIDRLSAIHAQIYDKIKTFKELEKFLDDLDAKEAAQKSREREDALLKSTEKIKMFNQTYLQDQVVKEFCHYVKRNADSWQNTRYRAPYAFLPQSSGSGKSRLVKESGQFLWLLYLSCCPEDSPRFPFRSSSTSLIMTFPNLLKYKHHTSDIVLALHVLFLAACLDQLRLFIVEEVPVLEQKPATINENYLIKWRDMQFQRDEGHLTIGTEFWKSISDHFHSLVAKYMPDVLLDSKVTSESTGHFRLAKSVLKESTQSVKNEFSLRCTGKNYILFAFDDAHQLVNNKLLNDTSFEYIRVALAQLPDGNLCHLDLKLFLTV